MGKWKKRECIICNKLKPVNEFKESKYFNKELCNSCREGYGLKTIRTAFIEYHQELHQDKTRKVKSNYKKYHTDPAFRERLIQTNKMFRIEYPEKAAAWDATHAQFRNIKQRYKGFNLHHWSYNKEHETDVILMRLKDHQKLHKFIIYDKQAKMYRDKRSGFLLNTKPLHAAYIDLILKTY